MGQKVNPHGMRVGIIRGWSSQWYADKKDFAKLLKEDNVIRDFLKKKYYQAAVSSISIERSEGKISVTMNTARPGVLIGKGGAAIAQLRKRAQARIEQFLGRPYRLELQVTVSPDWRNNADLLEKFGYLER